MIQEHMGKFPITEELRLFYSRIGKKGGKARAKKLSPARRKAIAANGAAVRERKRELVKA